MSTTARCCLFLLVSGSWASAADPQTNTMFATAADLNAVSFENTVMQRMTSLEAEVEAMRHMDDGGVHVGNDHRCSCLCPGWMVGAELLYIQPRRTGLDIGITDPNSDNNIQGPVESIGLDSNAGLRGSLGYRTYSGWDIVFTYTHFNTGNDRTVTEPAGGRLWQGKIHLRITTPAGVAPSREFKMESASGRPTQLC